MSFPLTQKMLMDWAGPQYFRAGQNLFEQGRVLLVEYEPPFIRGEITHAPRNLTCQFELLPGHAVENQCPCRDSQDRGIICSHVVALGLALIRRHSDPERERKAQEEMRRTARLAEVDPSRYLPRVSGEAPGAITAALRLILGPNWREAVPSGRIPLAAALEYHGRLERLDRLTSSGPFRLTPQDEAVLFVLEDISEGPAQGRLDVTPPDLINLLRLHAGKPLHEEGRPEPHTVNLAAMSSVLRLDLDRETGELILALHTELPFQDDTFPVYLVSGKAGWVQSAGHFWPLDTVLPSPLHGIYAKPAVIAREAVPRFLQTEWPALAQHLRIETELSLDLFTLDPGRPAFRLILRGSPASLAGTLYAEYGPIRLTAGRHEAAGAFALPDPDDLLRYTVRNPAAEQRALEQVNRLGFPGESGAALRAVVGHREVLNFVGRGLPRLKRLGWKVEFEGRIAAFLDTVEWTTPVVHIEEPDAGGWFDVGFQYEDGRGQSLSEAEIQQALLKGEAFIEKSGRTYLLDEEAISTARQVFADCASGDGARAGTFRLDGIYSAYVKASLDALDGVDIEATPSWQQRARTQNRIQPLTAEPLPDALDSVLRPYQQEGVYWLRFLERNAFGGILADEMGLGKTLQTLAWLRLGRERAEARGKPSLIVCPTSLVENWAEEAARFVPRLRVLTFSGAGRHEKREDISSADLVITSYALIRRDIEQLRAQDFSAVVLDEAQHIKNRSTQNAVAVKRLKAAHRFVLTGTPIENSVSDLWSIMDFLMPGYLGPHAQFRENCERPIAAGGPDADAAQARLRHKLHPFLLRRLKTAVAKDLPPRIERLATCTLTGDQQLVYRQLLESSQRRLFDLVAAQGFERSRMEILKTLLRLRQVCCHLELLKLPGLKSEYPSAKMDLFFELLDEAMDAGHRVLVFSQFTSMLAILRRELERRDLRYCYLDGATKERLKVVHEFNTQREIPLFLISLKAGGSGLNLTGADLVIHFDPWWNPAVEDQATDRAHRIGQKNTVYSIKLITRATVEEKVLALQKKKRAVIHAALAPDEDRVLRSLTWEDVQELLKA